MALEYRLREGAYVEGSFLVDEESGNVYELNEEASVVLSLISGDWLSPGGIVELLSEEWEFEDVERAVEDVKKFLESLRSEGVVLKRDSGDKA
ncbi:MAG: PqqD family protein [Candidatus Korarchaeota archaeon]|nr:PqqD family protein [Candidatus Korarchaeota archaeon]